MTVSNEETLLAVLSSPTPADWIPLALERGASRVAAVAAAAAASTGGPLLEEDALSLVSACLDATPRVAGNVAAFVRLLPMDKVPAAAVLPLLVSFAQPDDLDTWSLLFTPLPDDTARFRSVLKDRVSLREAGSLIERAVAVLEGGGGAGGAGRPLAPLVAWLTVLADTYGAQLALTHPQLLEKAHLVVARVVGETARLAPLGVQIKEELASARRRAMGKAGAVEFARTTKEYVLEVVEL